MFVDEPVLVARVMFLHVPVCVVCMLRVEQDIQRCWQYSTSPPRLLAGRLIGLVGHDVVVDMLTSTHMCQPPLRIRIACRNVRLRLLVSLACTLCVATLVG